MRQRRNSDRFAEEHASGVRVREDVRGRVPQHDLDAEAAVLSAVMLDREAMDKIAPLLRPEHFYSEANRRIYEAALHLLSQAAPVIDIVTVAARLRDTDRLAQVGGGEYLAQIVDATPAVAHVETHAGLVVDKWRLRSLCAFCQTVAAEAYSHSGPAKDLIEQAERGMYDLSRADIVQSFVPLGEPVGATFNHLLELANRNERMMGLSTGFWRLDSKLAGLHDGELVIIAARPGMGKTSFVLKVAENVSERDCKPRQGAAFFSIEMPKEQIAVRMLCLRARVNVGKLRRGFISQEEWDRLAAAAEELRDLPIYIDDSPSLTLSQLRSKLRRLIAEKRKEGVEIRVLIVDYLQLMVGIGNSREEEVASLSKGLKALSKEFGMPVIALAQLNRAVETRAAKDKRPQLSDLRESGAVEQDADTVIFIYRESYYDHEAEKPELAELIVAKQRNGPTGKTLCRFVAEYTRFENLANGEEPDEDEAA